MKVKIRVSYKLEDQEFPLDVVLDEKIREAMKSIGAESYGSGSGFSERDLVFEIESRQM